MLQQTQVKTVIPYFKIYKKFKTLKDLSEANQKSVLKLWEGLVIIEEQEICTQRQKF